MKFTNIISRITATIMIPVMLTSCAAYQLADKTPQFSVAKLDEATPGICGVAPFEYIPTDKGDANLMSQADLSKWHQMFYDAVNSADICKRTITLTSSLNLPDDVDYLIDGRISDFYFKKNWVPMFFPVWMGLTIFTFGIYGIAAGPTTSTRVNFSFVTNLKDAKTGKVLVSIPEKFASTDVMTMYSDDTKNPYGNPGLAFSPTLNDTTKKLAEALTRIAPKQPAGLTNTERNLQELRNQGILSEQAYQQKLNQLIHPNGQ
jgi:hypothetical protein